MAKEPRIWTSILPRGSAALAAAVALVSMSCNPTPVPSTLAPPTNSAPPTTSVTLPSSVDVDAIRNEILETGVGNVILVETNNTRDPVLDSLDVLSLKEGQSVSLEAFLNFRVEPNPPFVQFAALDGSGAKRLLGADVVGLPPEFQGKSVVVGFTGTVMGSSFPNLQIKVDRVNSITDVGPSLSAIKDNWSRVGNRLAQIIGASYSSDYYYTLYSEKTHELVVQQYVSADQESAYIAVFAINVIYFVGTQGSISRILVPYSQPRLTLPASPDRAQEAENTALLLGGQLRAPEALKNAVLADLGAIRSEYGPANPPIRSIEYTEPWSHSILLFLNDTSWTSYESGRYHEWDRLNRQFGSTVRSFINKGLVVEFNRDLHPRLVAEAYFKLPGVRGVSPNSLYGDHPEIYPRRTADQMTYLFRDAWGDCPAGCIEAHYWYFVCDKTHQPVLIGEYNPNAQQAKPAWWEDAQKNMQEFNRLGTIPELRKLG